MAATTKTSRLAIVALAVAIIQIALFTAAKLQVLPLAITQLGALGILTFILALIAYLRIRKSGGALKGKSLALISLAISIFPIIFLIALFLNITRMQR